ncbi:MAG: acyl-CoA dehydrogenase [Sphingomonas fennica]
MSLAAAIADATRALPVAGDPPDAPAMLALLRLLYATGRRDLPLGRLFEGHVDARQIVARYGTPAQAAAAQAEGAILGVWNADLPGEGLTLAGDRIDGGKSFASGAGLVTHALVTADLGGQRQLLLVDLARTPPAIEGDWWRVMGMHRSETHRVRWRHAPVAAADRIGAAGDYVREPYFSGGALRFAAVQAGGIAGLVDRVRDHLVAAGRAADPHQSGRLAALHAAAEAAAGAVRTAAAAWFTGGDDETRLAHVAAARAAVYAQGGAAITLAQEAVGLEGLFLDHPLCPHLTDLMVYLRQPGPDAQRMRVGAAVAAGRLRADL